VQLWKVGEAAPDVGLYDGPGPGPRDGETRP
jgi:hypothetical protein